jgi:hypothetical protein
MNRLEIMVANYDRLDSTIWKIASDISVKENIEFRNLCEIIYENTMSIWYDGRPIKVPRRKNLIVVLNGDGFLSVDNVTGLLKDCIKNVSGDLYLIILRESFSYPYLIWYFLTTILRIFQVPLFTEFSLSNLIRESERYKVGEQAIDHYILIWIEKMIPEKQKDSFIEESYKIEHDKMYGKYLT